MSFPTCTQQRALLIEKNLDEIPRPASKNNNIAPLINVPYTLPRMKSKAQPQASWAQYYVGQPDRKSMREKRQASLMRVSQLPKLKSLSSASAKASEHQQQMSVYAYQDLASPMCNVIEWTRACLQSAGAYLPHITMGPALAHAEEIKEQCDASTANQKIRIGAFIKQFEKDFEIRKSPLLKDADELNGAMIFIGEFHNDHDIQNQIRQVLHYLDTARGDMLVMEGNFFQCERFAPFYGIPIGSCESIEEDSPEYQALAKLLNTEKKILFEAVRVLKKDAPYLPWTSEPSSSVEHWKHFLDKYEENLTPASRPHYDRLRAQAKAFNDQFMQEVQERNPYREKFMFGKLKSLRNPAVNKFAILGQAHLVNLENELYQIKCLVMAPRIIRSQYAEYVLQPESRREL
ncbi:MAG: hypothetical protein WBJ21_02945 [Burkholderiaceae bacterium]